MFTISFVTILMIFVSSSLMHGGLFNEDMDSGKSPTLRAARLWDGSLLFTLQTLLRNSPFGFTDRLRVYSVAKGYPHTK